MYEDYVLEMIFPDYLSERMGVNDRSWISEEWEGDLRK
jgi:hypothetical protein